MHIDSMLQALKQHDSMVVVTGDDSVRGQVLDLASRIRKRRPSAPWWHDDDDPPPCPASAPLPKPLPILDAAVAVVAA